MTNLRTSVPQAVGVIGAPSPSTTTASMATNGHTPSFAQDHWDRYAYLKSVEDAKNALIEDILCRYDAVVRQCNSLIEEQGAQSCDKPRVNGEQPTYQDQAEYIVYLQGLMDSNPFVTVVVDGNSLVFRDDLVRGGLDGGRRAAVMLRDELIEWIPKNVEHAPSEVKVVVKVYADLKSLATRFVKTGVIAKSSIMGDFARGFNSLYEFVDIGTCDVGGKVVDHLKLFLHDYHCRQVFFGGTLYQLYMNVESEKLQSRVTLLQGTLGDSDSLFKTACFPEIFRTAKTTTDIASATPPPRTPMSAVSAVSSTIGNSPTPALPYHDRTQTHSPASSVASTEQPGGKSTWAKLAQSVATLPQTDMVPRVATPTPPTNQTHNKKGQRIDPPWDYDWDTLQRVKKIKMCNMHYLHPDGCKWPASKCNHRHDYEPTEAELKVLSCVSRETACHNGASCDELVCVYGHRCPYPTVPDGSMRGLGCVMGDKCRFPREMHGIKDSTPSRSNK